MPKSGSFWYMFAGIVVAASVATTAYAQDPSVVFAEILSRPNATSFTERWIGGEPGAEDLAQRVSPMTYLGEQSPPIVTIHGDRDPIIPYEQSTRLHRALDGLGMANRLVTVEGGKHGRFTADEHRRACIAIGEFLEEHVSPDR